MKAQVTSRLTILISGGNLLLYIPWMEVAIVVKAEVCRKQPSITKTHYKSPKTSRQRQQCLRSHTADIQLWDSRHRIVNIHSHARKFIAIFLEAVNESRHLSGYFLGTVNISRRLSYQTANIQLRSTFAVSKNNYWQSDIYFGLSKICMRKH